MARSLAFLAVGIAMAVAGCATPAPFLDSKQAMAVSPWGGTAENRPSTGRRRS